MSRVAKYDTDIRNLGAILARMGITRPAPTIRATAPTPNRPTVYASTGRDVGQATTAVGRHTMRDRSDEATTSVISRYAINQALSRQASEDPPLYQQLVAAHGYPTFEQEGGEGRE